MTLVREAIIVSQRLHSQGLLFHFGQSFLKRRCLLVHDHYIVFCLLKKLLVLHWCHSCRVSFGFSVVQRLLLFEVGISKFHILGRSYFPIERWRFWATLGIVLDVECSQLLVSERLAHVEGNGLPIRALVNFTELRSRDTARFTSRWRMYVALQEALDLIEVHSALTKSTKFPGPLHFSQLSDVVLSVAVWTESIDVGAWHVFGR